MGLGEFGNWQMVEAARHLLRRAMAHFGRWKEPASAFVGCCARKTIGSSRNRGQLNRGAFGRCRNLAGSVTSSSVLEG